MPVTKADLKCLFREAISFRPVSANLRATGGGCAEGAKGTTVLSGGGDSLIRDTVCLSAAAAVGKVVQILASWLGCHQIRYSCANCQPENDLWNGK